MITALKFAEKLAARFNLTELQRELHVTDLNTHFDSDDYGFWYWHRLAVEEAIDLVKLAEPKPIPRTGHIDIETVRARADIIALVAGYNLQLRKSSRNFKRGWQYIPIYNPRSRVGL